MDGWKELLFTGVFLVIAALALSFVTMPSVHAAQPIEVDVKRPNA